MYRKLTRILALAMVMLFVVSTVVLAGGMMSGKVTSVDAKKGTVTLITKDGDTQALQASEKLLAGLKSGDSVSIEVEGNRVKAIKKQK
jgi:hypothetical protein